jgi:carboxypeptidase Taq
MYDLGLPVEWRDQPVGRDRGLALEESQSLLFEMNLCRSRSFVKYVRPLMEKYLQVSGPEWEEANLYRHLIRVRRSTIRMDADELTYPVHIMLRYELEKRILEGSLPVADLPEAWNANLEQRLNIRAANDVEGCLQDIHWAVGHFGYFPSYALGAVIAGQLNEAMRAARPALDEEIAAGQFGGVMDWLRDNVHGVGARLPVQELIKHATGKPLTAAAYLRYLETKYLEIP